MRETIGFVTDEKEYVGKYGRAIRGAKSRAGLIERIKPYEQAADDALRQASAMSDADFVDFKRDLKKARKEQHEAWIEKFNERFGDIAMPYKMLIASLTASQFHCPWGCAFLRLQEIGFPPRKV
jgi:hypothetical protein